MLPCWTAGNFYHDWLFQLVEKRFVRSEADNEKFEYIMDLTASNYSPGQDIRYEKRIVQTSTWNVHNNMIRVMHQGTWYLQLLQKDPRELTYLKRYNL